MRETTLCYIERDGMYLMLHRSAKKKDGSVGKWMGVGGKLEPGETPDECMLREVNEETGLTLTKYCKRGVVHFYSDTWEDEIMHLYSGYEYEGRLIDYCDEGELKFIPVAEVMELNMWEGDRIFLKKIADGEMDFDIELRYEGDKLVYSGELTEREVI